MVKELAATYFIVRWRQYRIWFDILAKTLRKKLSISSIRVKKFCSNTMFEATNIKYTDFKAPVTLAEGLKRTIQYEFIDKVEDHVFYTE